MNIKDYKPGQLLELDGVLFQSNYMSTPMWADTCPSGGGYTELVKVRINCQLPTTFNATAAELASIERDLAAAAEAYHSTVADLRTRKQRLLQLTHEATGTSDIIDADDTSAPAPTFTDIDADFSF